ncbi:MAG: DMT family transporter [Spirochaeta sp.]|jgi:drug/metabolite transporter (DMT)-like permease|nr:DMT family transporter [Spirochaeta sp.]
MQSDTRETLKGIIAVNVATLAWATNMTIGRYVRGVIGPLTLTAARYVVAVILFTLLLRHVPPEERRPGRDLLPLLGMAVAGIVFFAPLLYFGLRYTTAVNGTLINGMGPLLTALFAAWLIREPYTGRQLIGAACAVVGVVVLITGGSLETIRTVGVNPGDLLIVAAATAWGLQSVASRRATRNRSPLSATILSLYMGLPFLIVAAILEQRVLPVTITPRLIGIVIYLGVVPAGLGYFLWNTGVKKLGAGGAMVFYNMLPVYGTILGVSLLGEQVGPAHAVGGALIIGGGLFSAYARRRAPRSASNRTRRSGGDAG